MTMILNALIALLVLGGLTIKLAHNSPDPHRWFSCGARGAAQAAIGVGLLGFAYAPLVGQVYEGAQTALLVGLAVLLLVRWRRRSES